MSGRSRATKAPRNVPRIKALRSIDGQAEQWPASCSPVRQPPCRRRNTIAVWNINEGGIEAPFPACVGRRSGEDHERPLSNESRRSRDSRRRKPSTPRSDSWRRSVAFTRRRPSRPSPTRPTDLALAGRPEGVAAGVAPAATSAPGTSLPRRAGLAAVSITAIPCRGSPRTRLRP